MRDAEWFKEGKTGTKSRADQVGQDKRGSYMRIALVDYKKGNIKSVERGLAEAAESIGLPAEIVLVDTPGALCDFDAIVLPGVGAFTDAMETLEATGLAETLRTRIAEEIPFLGICLGLHLMFEAGTEHASGASTPGLGIIPGIVDHMPAQNASGEIFKIPHVGWNTVSQREMNGSSSPLFNDIADGEYFYFTHSYIAPASDATIGQTEHSVVFPSVVQKGNAFGVQFHPEKSSAPGIRLLANFLAIANDAHV